MVGDAGRPPPASAEGDRQTDRRSIVIVVIGFLAIWLALDQSARRLGSFSGEAGIFVCVLVLAVALVVEWLLFDVAPAKALSAIA